MGVMTSPVQPTNIFRAYLFENNIWSCSAQATDLPDTNWQEECYAFLKNVKKVKMILTVNGFIFVLQC